MNTHFGLHARLQRMLTLAAALLAMPVLALAQMDPPGRVGRLADLHGGVSVFDAQDGTWRAAERNLPVTGGDRFSTDRDARAELRVGSTVLRLGAGTELEVLHLDDDRLQVQLHRGALALRILSGEIAAATEVVTAEGRLQPLRAGHYRVDRIDDTSFGGVWRGEMQYSGEDNLRLIGSGERIEFWRDERRGMARTRDADMPRDRLAAWAIEADQRAHRSASHRYVSPEMTGAEDLDRHGHWEQHPEYGAIWLPHSVGPDWAPYRDGRWVWQRPWGWTWVDAAPWGFAPFHYGRWVSWRGRWCWTPGAYQARPVFAPALVAWIGGPNVGVSISIGNAPHVGWVPLAPREVYVPAYRVTPIYVDRINRGHDRHHRPGRDHRPGRGQGPGQVPTGPIMYSNQGVPGAVTVVPSNVLRTNQPVAPVAVAPSQVVRTAPTTVIAPPPPRRERSPRHDDEDREPVMRPVPGGAVPEGRVRDGRGPDGRGSEARVPAPEAAAAVPVLVPPRAGQPPRHDEAQDGPVMVRPMPAAPAAEPRGREARAPQVREADRRGRDDSPRQREEPQRAREQPPMRAPESRQDQRRRDQVQ